MLILTSIRLKNGYNNINDFFLLSEALQVPIVIYQQQKQRVYIRFTKEKVKLSSIEWHENTMKFRSYQIQWTLAQ